ncbi:unnamed protein product [Fraxinus pennsylvanica]|uniref:Malectin-like domain-containing protein n=1 Tax=Fraxinus pennsylvanica TaxID=56036 RepID=A0AAD2A3P2_9LAMI|nr:unnamed protein product [Fraxinus pennsylvanica]
MKNLAGTIFEMKLLIPLYLKIINAQWSSLYLLSWFKNGKLQTKIGRERNTSTGYNWKQKVKTQIRCCWLVELKMVGKILMTWRFQVDPNFMYLVRLHWCDDEVSDDEMTKTNERIFDVYINNQTAANTVDLFAWQNSVTSPTTRDNAIRVSNKSRDAELWVTLRPNVKERPLYVDVLLNGLEIFKLSKSNLAGSNPTISDMMRNYQEKQAASPNAFAQKSTTTTMALISGAAGGAAAFGVAAAIFLVAHKKKKRVPGDATSWLPISWNSSTTSGAKSSVSGKSQGSSTISSDAANSGGSDSGMDHQNAEQIDQNNLIAMHRNTLNLGSDDDANDSSDDSTDDVFSQIANPKGL